MVPRALRFDRIVYHCAFKRNRTRLCFCHDHYRKTKIVKACLCNRAYLTGITLLNSICAIPIDPFSCRFPSVCPMPKHYHSVLCHCEPVYLNVERDESRTESNSFFHQLDFPCGSLITSSNINSQDNLF